MSRLREGIVTRNGSVHYTVHFKDGSSLESRVTERAIRGLRLVDIDWIWIVELRRRATAEEVSKPCEISSSPYEVTQHAS
jgi:hypothetical protein